MRATGAVLAVLAVLAAGGLATACARGASGTPNAAPSGSYLDCLREHGVNLPQGVASGRSRPSGLGPSGIRPSGVARSGGSGAGGFFGTQAPAGVDQSTWEKALQACAALRPSVNPSRFRDNGAAAAYRNCLAEHGVTVSGPIDQLDISDPKGAAALQTCAPLRPSNRPSPAPSSRARRHGARDWPGRRRYTDRGRRFQAAGPLFERGSSHLITTVDGTMSMGHRRGPSRMSLFGGPP